MSTCLFFFALWLSFQEFTEILQRGVDRPYVGFTTLPGRIQDWANRGRLPLINPAYCQNGTKGWILAAELKNEISRDDCVSRLGKGRNQKIMFGILFLWKSINQVLNLTQICWFQIDRAFSAQFWIFLAIFGHSPARLSFDKETVIMVAFGTFFTLNSPAGQKWQEVANGWEIQTFLLYQMMYVFCLFYFDIGIQSPVGRSPMRQDEPLSFIKPQGMRRDSQKIRCYTYGI